MNQNEKNTLDQISPVDNQKEKIINKINKIKKKIQQLTKEQKNIQLRYYADIDNLIKKNKKEIKFIKNNKFKNFLKSVIPIIDKIDNLAKISINSNSIQKTITEGIQLTFNLSEKNLKTWNIKRINKINIPFDPKIHLLATNQKINDDSNKKIVKTIKENGYVLKKEIIKKAIITI
ncbi:Protein GrpE [Buchnera aphidicola (Cinara kochiana kochiana)]|uniref:Protein GrpE n=1 Tax=Buchnera aphidicola (Cinara kochiana kochiana) TaxID=2518976 RepID=A0A451D5R6_9GAMM|nr:Protein GrpE [Buchnera aphidicola (Cinara kochiana kochiana)]